MKLLWIFIYPHLIESSNPIKDAILLGTLKKGDQLPSLNSLGHRGKSALCCCAVSVEWRKV
jgi:hypothetical protein